jgi:hypothetical protein
MKKLLLALFSLTSASLAFSQYNGSQYFDGADSTFYTGPWVNGSIYVYTDSNPQNIWQVGKPQKVIFDSAATYRNAIVTDTVNPYPVGNTSSFYFDYANHYMSHEILGIQWKQKLDMDKGTDGGLVEFSFDYGATWLNAFNNPYVWNFFGYDPQNKDTLSTGEYAFSGTDSTWKDVWLCYQLDFVASMTDSIKIRFTFKSDSVNNNREGWMIDNLQTHITIMHPVKETAKKDYFNISPNPADNTIHVELAQATGYHIIEEMELISADGKSLQKWNKIPTRFWFDVSKYPVGQYYLKIRSNLQSQTLPVVIQR